MASQSGRKTISTKQARIAKLAQQMPGRTMCSLSHHMDLEWLMEAFRRTRKDGAVGTDGQTADEYAEHLEDNLRSLLDEAKSGLYRAPPVRRVHIPKGDGSKTRPIGIPTFEDKVLQRAVAMLLEPVYEEDFYDFSYGFRPRRSAHDALEALDQGLFDMRGGWVLDVDITSFFDTLDHQKLRDLLRLRVVVVGDHLTIRRVVETPDVPEASRGPRRSVWASDDDSTRRQSARQRFGMRPRWACAPRPRSTGSQQAV